MEFFIYHDMSNSMTSEHQSVFLSQNFELPPFIHMNHRAFVGVCDGLFGFISNVRRLRDHIRARRSNGEKPDVDFPTILEGRTIDADLKQIDTAHEHGTAEWICWQLYRTCVWLYLHRTVNASLPNPQLRAGVEEALIYLQAVPPDDAAQSLLLTPIFMVGCSTFSENHRDAVLDALDTLENYSHLGNIKPAREVIKEIWRLMDAGDEMSWDWESVMKAMGYDFLVT